MPVPPKPHTQVLVFLLNGAVSTAIQFGVMISFVTFFGLSPVLASGAGYVIGALVNYWLNYNFAFESSAPHLIASYRFTLVACGGLLLNSGFMFVMLHAFSFNYLVAQVFATMAVVVWSFCLGKSWTFSATQD